MKIITLVTMISCIFTSCIRQEEGDYKLRFNKSFTIEAGSSTILTHVYVFNIQSGWSNLLTSNNLLTSDIDRVSVRNINLSPLLSNEISYRFVEEVKAFVSDPSKPNSRLQIGSANPSPNERTSNLFLLSGIADIKDFVSLNQFRIELEIRYRDIITSNSDHSIELEFDIFKK